MNPLYEKILIGCAIAATVGLLLSVLCTIKATAASTKYLKQHNPDVA